MPIRYPTAEDLRIARDDPHTLQRELALLVILIAALEAETIEDLREAFVAYMEWK
jgi:hypothetical protein